MPSFLRSTMWGVLGASLAVCGGHPIGAMLAWGWIFMGMGFFIALAALPLDMIVRVLVRSRPRGPVAVYALLLGVPFGFLAWRVARYAFFRSWEPTGDFVKEWLLIGTATGLGMGWGAHRGIYHEE